MEGGKPAPPRFPGGEDRCRTCGPGGPAEVLGRGGGGEVSRARFWSGGPWNDSGSVTPCPEALPWGPPGAADGGVLPGGRGGSCGWVMGRGQKPQLEGRTVQSVPMRPPRPVSGQDPGPLLTLALSLLGPASQALASPAAPAPMGQAQVRPPGPSFHQAPSPRVQPRRPAAHWLSQQEPPRAPVAINAYLIMIFFLLLQKLRNGLRPSAGNENLIKVGFCARLAL